MTLSADDTGGGLATVVRVSPALVRRARERIFELRQAGQPVSRELTQLAAARSVAATAHTDEASERMSKGGKDEERTLGVLIKTTNYDRYVEDARGSGRERLDVTPIDLAPDEAALVSLALLLDAAEPRDVALEPSFEELLRAALTRSAVRFDYREAAQGTAAGRHVHPWGLGMWHRRWYLIGLDVDRGDRRLFQLGRVAGAVTVIGEPEAFPPPPPGAVHDALSGLDAVGKPASAGGTARLRVRRGAGLELQQGVGAPDTRPGGDWDVIELPYSDPAVLADDIVSYGPDVIVLEPAEVRDAVIERLHSVVADRISFAQAENLARRPLRLDAASAATLLVATRALADTAGPEHRAVIDRVQAKLEAAAGSHASAAAGHGSRESDAGPEGPTGPPVEVQFSAEGTPEVRAAVRVARKSGRLLHIVYDGATDDLPIDRDVDPRGLRTG